MKLTSRELWSELTATYWFVPSLMTLGGIGLAVLAQMLDRTLAFRGLGALTLFYPDTPDGSRQLHAAIVGSMITVVSVTFSITIVALTVASQHFGPRLLNSFMRDKAVQAVLGIFIGTFAYSMLALGAVREYKASRACRI